MSKATVIAITKPVKIDFNGTPIGQFDQSKIAQNREMTSDEFIAYAARVSNPSNQNNHLTAPKLIKYLIKNRHWSPFEMVSATIEIETTRDIARQILRHRSFSFQEFSQRYANPSALGFEYREARFQDTKNRQNSIEEGVSQALVIEWHNKQNDVMNAASEAYAWATENNIAKEQARVVLPEGMTLSRLYIAGTLRSWTHYCGLRMMKGTQKEHRIIAEKCWADLITYFPSMGEYNPTEDPQWEELNKGST